jgi:putative RecB family exonuclease
MPVRLIDEAKLLLLEYLKNTSKNGVPMVKGVETPFNIKITDEILLRGYIDRIDITDDGIFKIVDYKTTKNVKYLDAFQLLVYGLWLKKQYPEIDRFKASYVLLRHGSKTKDYEFNIEDLKKAEKDIIGYANKIKSEDQWTTIPTALCNWCDFKNICPAQQAW